MAQFHVPQVQWRRISPKYIAREVIQHVLGLLFFVVVTVVVFVLAGDQWWLIPVPFILISVLQLAMVVPRNRSIQFALRNDDIMVRRGVLYSHLVAVPYGRMQSVTVQSGPLDRLMGLGSVTMSTASMGASATVPGLPVREAEALRDHLVRVAETRRAGL